jgi:hypothetical protein
MKSISVVTLGCKVNQYDTAAILNKLPRSKYVRVPFPEKADVYVIDTCTVTHKADAEARQYIRRARRANPNGVVIVTGCYAQLKPEDVASIDGVDYVMGTREKASIASAILSKVTGSGWPGKDFLKSAIYSGMLFKTLITISGVLFISTEAWTGPFACCFRSSALPSQNWATLNTEFSTVGAFLGPFCQWWPTEVS